ncbi:calcium-binding protein [Altererythrobacter sp. CAU 1778]
MAEATVSTIQQLRAALSDPNITIINVAPGNYTVSDGVYLGGSNGFNITHDVTIRVTPGATGRANFFAATDFAKGLFFVAEGASATFEGIGFYNTDDDPTGSASSNEAGIRFEGVNLTVIDSYFENNKNGILGTSPGSSATLTVRASFFIDNGTDSGQEHAIYFQGLSVDVEDSEFSGFGDGHAIKTVVNSTRVVDNIISDGGYGYSNHPVNLEGGGSLIATGNTITKSSNAANQYSGNGYIFYTSAARSNDDEGETILIANNAISSAYVNTGGNPGTVLLGNFSGAAATISNNTLTGTFDPDLGVYGYATFSGNTLDGNALPSTYDWAAVAVSLTNGADTVTLDTSSGLYSGNYFAAYEGLDGDDTINSASSGYFVKVVNGGLGDDILTGGSGNDWLYGGAGNDVVKSGSFNSNRMQYLNGGEGDDYLEVQGANGFADILVGMEGNDVLDARNATRADLGGGTGNDILIGSAETDAFSGGAGDDIVYGNGGGEQYLYGGEGIDTFVYAGTYGANADLFVEWQYDVNLLVVSRSSAGQVETGGAEHLSEFEYIQFSNGVYDVAARAFTSGEVRVDLAAILSLNSTNYLSGTGTGGGSGGSGGSGGGGGSIPYPVTTNSVAYDGYTMDGTSQNDLIDLTAGEANGNYARGFGGDDHIISDDWNSALVGGDGSDVIEVRRFAKVAGDDDIDRYGGVISVNTTRAADYFVFDVTAFAGAGWEMSPSENWGRILDFDDGLDKIALLNAGSDGDDFADLTIVQDGADTVITTVDTAQIRLINFSAANLDASDFIFSDDGTGTGGGSGGSGGSGGGGGSIPYPVTTNSVAYDGYTMDGTSQNDLIDLTAGEANGNYARGFGGDDHIINDDWNSALVGGDGSDVIEVRRFAKVAGDDDIDRYGGVISVNTTRAADYFVFDVTAFAGAGWEMSPSENWGRILDFDDGLDKIALLNAGSDGDDFADLTIVQDGADTVITTVDTAQIRLINFSAANLDASDFIFSESTQSTSQFSTTRVAANEIEGGASLGRMAPPQKDYRRRWAQPFDEPAFAADQPVAGRGRSQLPGPISTSAFAVPDLHALMETPFSEARGSIAGISQSRDFDGQDVVQFSEDAAPMAISSRLARIVEDMAAFAPAGATGITASQAGRDSWYQPEIYS